MSGRRPRIFLKIFYHSHDFFRIKWLLKIWKTLLTTAPLKILWQFWGKIMLGLWWPNWCDCNLIWAVWLKLYFYGALWRLATAVYYMRGRVWKSTVVGGKSRVYPAARWFSRVFFRLLFFFITMGGCSCALWARNNQKFIFNMNFNSCTVQANSLYKHLPRMLSSRLGFFGCPEADFCFYGSPVAWGIDFERFQNRRSGRISR